MVLGFFFFLIFFPTLEVLSKQDLAAARCPAACDNCRALLLLSRLHSVFPEQHVAS